MWGGGTYVGGEMINRLLEGKVTPRQLATMFGLGSRFDGEESLPFIANSPVDAKRWRAAILSVRGELGALVGIAELVAEQHQHDRRRDDLAQRARCGDRAVSSRVVAGTQHHRQRDQAHRHHEIGRASCRERV